MSKDRISFKEINRLAIPAIFAGIAEPIIGIVDTGIAGNVGTNTEITQAAVGLGATFYSLLLWSLSQIRTAISSIISIYLGAKRLKDIVSLIPQTLLLGVILGGIISSIAYVNSEQVFINFYGVEVPEKQELLTETITYFKIRILGLPISLSVFILFGIFRGLQNTLWIMKASIIGAFLNAVFDYILVFGIGNFNPNMGIEGIAMASVISQLVMLIIALYFLRFKGQIKLKVSSVINSEFGNMLKMAGNMLLRTLALNLAFFLGNRYATSYGESYIAAHTMLSNIWVFSFFFIDGFSNAGNALAGKLLGSKDFRKLRILAVDLIKMNLKVAGFLALFFLLMYPFIGSLLSNQHEVVSLFNGIFWLVILTQFINAVTFTFDGIFKGLGEAVYLRNTLFIASFLVFWPSVYFFNVIGFKLFAIWISFMLWNIFRGASLIYKFRKVYNAS